MLLVMATGTGKTIERADGSKIDLPLAMDRDRSDSRGIVGFARTYVQ